MEEDGRCSLIWTVFEVELKSKQREHEVVLFYIEAW